MSVESTSPVRILIQDGCPHCETYMKENPEVVKAAVPIEIEEKKCGPLPGLTPPDGETCYTGRDLAEMAGVQWTPACLIVQKDGLVRECSDAEEKLVQKGVIPTLAEPRVEAPRAPPPIELPKFQFEGFWSDRP